MLALQALLHVLTYVDVYAFITVSYTLLVNFIVLIVIGIGWFDRPQRPKEPEDGYSGTFRGQATCDNREMYEVVGIWRGFASLRVVKGEVALELLRLSATGS